MNMNAIHLGLLMIYLNRFSSGWKGHVAYNCSQPYKLSWTYSESILTIFNIEHVNIALGYHIQL